MKAAGRRQSLPDRNFCFSFSSLQGRGGHHKDKAERDTNLPESQARFPEHSLCAGATRRDGDVSHSGATEEEAEKALEGSCALRMKGRHPQRDLFEDSSNPSPSRERN